MTPFLSCEKAAKLMSQALDEPLGVVDQLRLKYHLSICGDCRNVDGQFKELNRLMQSPDAFNVANTTEMNSDGKSQV